MTRPRPAIVFPSGETTHADFTFSLANLCHSTPPLETPIINVRSSIVATARNNGVDLARQAGATHVLFLDSDMVFPRTTLSRLLAHEKDIVGCTYLRRTPPFSPLGSRRADEACAEGEALIAMSRLPTGCLLVRMKVFDKLDKPSFRYGINRETGEIVGEDYDFCDRARQAGFDLWCDAVLSFEIGHIGQTIHQIKAA